MLDIVLQIYVLNTDLGCNAFVGIIPVVQQSYTSHVLEPDSLQLHGAMYLVGSDNEAECDHINDGCLMEDIAGGIRPFKIAQFNFRAADLLTQTTGKLICDIMFL